METYRRLVHRDLPWRERACQSKAAFVSRSEAGTVCRHGRRSNGRLFPYHCRFCSLWHLGHRRPRHAAPAAT